MGVYCDKYVGFCIDIQDMWNTLSDTDKEFWLEDFNNTNSDKYDELNFRPYYNRTGSLKNKVTILYDGMSGEYCYLMYVIDYDNNSDFEDCEHLVESINKLLEDCGIEFEIKSQIKNVYKAMFNKDMTLTSYIKAKYILHYH